MTELAGTSYTTLYAFIQLLISLGKDERIYTFPIVHARGNIATVKCGLFYDTQS